MIRFESWASRWLVPVGLLLLLSLPVRAGVLLGHTWPGNVMILNVGMLEEPWRGYFEEAVAIWNDAAVNFTVTTVAQFGAGQCLNDNSYGMVFFSRQSCQGGPFRDTGFGQAYTWGQAQGRYIPKADILFNSATTWTKDKFIAVALHELGHAIGLDHSNSAVSTMNIAANHPLPGWDDVYTLWTRYGNAPMVRLTLRNQGAGYLQVRPAVDGTLVLKNDTWVIAGNYNNLDCHQVECNYLLQHGLRLQVTAIANSGSRVERIDGANTSTNVARLAPLESPRTLTAVFFPGSASGVIDQNPNTGRTPPLLLGNNDLAPDYYLSCLCSVSWDFGHYDTFREGITRIHGTGEVQNQSLQSPPNGMYYANLFAAPTLEVMTYDLLNNGALLGDGYVVAGQPLVMNPLNAKVFNSFRVPVGGYYYVVLSLYAGVNYSEHAGSIYLNRSPVSGRPQRVFLGDTSAIYDIRRQRASFLVRQLNGSGGYYMVWAKIQPPGSDGRLRLVIESSELVPNALIFELGLKPSATYERIRGELDIPELYFIDSSVTSVDRNTPMHKGIKASIPDLSVGSVITVLSIEQ